MVDRADLPKINMLYSERATIMQFQKLMNEPGFHIISMTGNIPREQGGDLMFGPSATVGTSQMEYPPQMIEVIKGYLATREAAIVEELTKLGVTGIDEPETPAPQHQPQRAAAAPPHRAAPPKGKRA